MALNGINTSDSPCKQCPNRYVGCHSTCVKYLDWSQQYKIKLEQRREQKKIDNLLFDNQTRRNRQVRNEGGIKYGRRSNDTR